MLKMLKTEADALGMVVMLEETAEASAGVAPPPLVAMVVIVVVLEKLSWVATAAAGV